MTSRDSLAASQFALVTTFRKDGRPVPTPVWIVPFQDGLGFWTVADSGKIKRIRRNPQVTVATCDSRGGNAGPSATGTARLVDDDGAEHIRAAIRRKYGLPGRTILLLSRFRRGKHATVGVKIILDGPEG